MTISLSTLDPQIASRSLLKHPFYVAWSKGELTLGDLRVYAKEYFHLVERIPGIVARVSIRVQDQALRDRIRENMREEAEHVELWKRFAKSLGISEDELLEHQASAKVQSAVATLEKLAEEGMEEGIVGMYAMEAELPAIAATKKDGLCKFYGLDSEDAQVYFDEHLKEEQHLQVWRAFSVDQQRAEAAAATSLTAQNQVLDAVCETCGISMSC
ncbi:MAG: pyrroloquinoline quinone biosynthesis protein PqqC [Candidatus Peribacteraceae bacterium]|nr:pyrroloquinoline quinone biosynthesis protein PqqC [Candidatus Peribacteraceae bacterium]